MKSKFLLLFATVIIVSCSAPEETVKKNADNYEESSKFVNKVNLEIDQNICWINSLPGTAPKFHVSGKITLLSGDDYSSDTELKYIRIFQAGSELYYIMPKVVIDKKRGVKKITYSTIKGLSISQNLDKQKPVILELIFVDDSDEFTYRINNVNVEEVQ